MDTGILSPKALFQKDIRYTVPAFQRRYVWTLDDQWEPLWEDVRNTAEDYLEKLDHSNGDGIKAEQETVRHFLGAVVVQQVNTATRDVERREVIDGQQRLTTLQLLLDAIQYVCEEHKTRGVATRLSKLVTNDESLVGDGDNIFKLWPTTHDREAFRHAMHNGLATDDYEQSLIVQAHEYFQLQARHWIGGNTEAFQVRAEALETAVTGMLQMVVIDLGPEDDPHVIFETLNARGTPLLESDLIKNYVSSKSGQDNIWGNLDHNWWRQDFRQGRLLRPRIDALLDYWLEARTLDDVSAGKVFNVFRKVSSDRGCCLGSQQRPVELSLLRGRSERARGKCVPLSRQRHADGSFYSGPFDHPIQTGRNPMRCPAGAGEFSYSADGVPIYHQGLQQAGA